MSKDQVLETLVEQTELVRGGSELVEGNLRHFRAAIEMESFSEVVEWVKTSLEENLFTSLHDIQRMEEDWRNGDKSELVVQCCLILELVIHCTYILDEQSLRRQRMSVFDHCQTLEEIAHLRFRLNFLGPRSAIRESVEFSLLDAVHACVTDSAPTWMEILLVLRVGNRDTLLRLLGAFFDSLTYEGLLGIPKPAATLLLSFVCEAMRGEHCPGSEERALRLLQIGASPMVSTADHQSLFKEIFEQHPRAVEDHPWWLEAEGPEPRSAEWAPTALRRLLNRRRNPELRFALKHITCCPLDAFRFSRKTLPRELPSLKCLAARQIQQSQLAALPRCLQLVASKHWSPY